MALTDDAHQAGRRELVDAVMVVGWALARGLRASGTVSRRRTSVAVEAGGARALESMAIPRNGPPDGSTADWSIRRAHHVTGTGVAGARPRLAGLIHQRDDFVRGIVQLRRMGRGGRVGLGV